MVTGSLQVKGLVYYVVLNVYPNNKRNQKWIPTTVIADGKKVNQMKAEKLLSDIRMIYSKDSYIDNKKTAEQLLKEQNQSKSMELSILPQTNKDNQTQQREYRKSCVNKSFRDKIKNIKEGFFLWEKK